VSVRSGICGLAIARAATLGIAGLYAALHSLAIAAL
jgi:hypothetical protein